ncbi:hypothetical protein [Azospirillum sp. TSO35-2]|uniref:hypothetical protein n=1 Tax=Azospirillum sp. TSO35-2 TaxID=716796 RepID=UPI0011B50646|nr:hypothetical protein [Azospirillum sp. TSO35-2]
MSIPKSATPKILRAAMSLKQGTEILHELRSTTSRTALKSAVDEGLPSVAKISGMLLEKFGAQARAMPVRQFCGMAVKAIMEEEGYEVAATGVRIPNDPVFSTGAVYRKVEGADETGTPDILERFVNALDRDELERVVRLATKALEHAE